MQPHRVTWVSDLQLLLTCLVELCVVGRPCVPPKKGTKRKLYKLTGTSRESFEKERERESEKEKKRKEKRKREREKEREKEKRREKA